MSRIFQQMGRVGWMEEEVVISYMRDNFRAQLELGGVSVTRKENMTGVVLHLRLNTSPVVASLGKPSISYLYL